MTREEYLTELLLNYELVSVLSNNNNCRVLRLRNKKLDKCLICRSYPKVVCAYEELYSVKCEHLPLIYDAVRLDDGQIVLEEYIDGMTVAQIMETGRYKGPGVKKVICGVCNALMVLHERGLVHRDIKPENVMIDNRGRVVLIDFNTSRKIASVKKDTVVMGTVGYASPEQLGVSQTDARTDIYALGVLLNVMITGKHPSEKIARGRWGRIVRKCTHINPKDRFQSAEKLLKYI